MIPDQFRLIATSAPLVRAAGPAAAIWIGNAISAQDWSEKECKESWWWATKAEIEARTGLSDEMQETARRRLRDLGVLEERRGVLSRGASLATIWYRLDMEKLSAIVYREPRQSNPGEHGNRIPANPVNDHTSLTSSLTSEEQPPVSPKGDSPQVLEVLKIWNNAIASESSRLPLARPNGKRVAAIKVRLREPGWLDDFKAAVTFVCRSPWHCGGNDRSWVATIDFMLRPGKATELAERSRATPQGIPLAPVRTGVPAASMTAKDVRRAIWEDGNLLQKIDAEIRGLHVARCKFPMGSPEFQEGTEKWQEAMSRAGIVKNRIASLQKQLEVMPHG